MRTLQDVQRWRGMAMTDPDGDKIGEIQDIYLDRDTGEPEWATVRTGLFGTKVSFVPIRDAQESGDAVRVPFQKDQVKDAPRIDPDGELSPEEERQLYQHYGRSDYDQWQGQDRTTELGLPEEREPRFSRQGDEAAGTGAGAGAAAGTGTGTDTGTGTEAGMGAGDPADEAPAIVGVRLRRVVIVEPDTDMPGGPGDAPRP